MILQKLLLPNKDICDSYPLYIRESNGAYYDLENMKLTFSLHGRCKFDTYFNAFSLLKWKEYTDISTLFLHLKMKGKFIIQFSKALIENKGVDQSVLYSFYFEDEITVDLNVEELDGIIAFELECLSEDGEFISGEYYTNDKPLRNPKIMMAVCTFRREEYILGNLKQIEDTILNNKESVLRNSLDIFVSDNGNTLPTEGFNKHITIAYNKNTGGAGGFTRGMIELLNRQEKEQYTHILLTDDDIKLEPSVLERLFALLSFLKEKYREAFVGGSMFRTDTMHVQNELANRWEKGSVVPLKHNVQMNSYANVCLNEGPDNINYFSWWFCAMPVGVVSKVNLPLPIFIKRDDIEYGLRNGSTFITLNGINVWHEPFEGKRPAYLEYYYIRNQLIMESTLVRNMSTNGIIRKVKYRMTDDLAKFHYLEFKFFVKGIIDYCKGIDYFKGIDAVQLNNDLRAMDRKFLPLKELEIPFDEDKYWESFATSEPKWKFIIRKMTLNGWILPSKKEPAIVQSAFPIRKPFFRRRTALNVEYISKTGYISHKSWKEFFECCKLYKEVIKTIKKYYKNAVKEYVDRWRELITYDFWNNYLFGEVVPSNKQTPAIDKTDSPKEKIKKQTFYFDYIDKSKVNPKVIYLESRKGTDFASNIFAVAKELHKDEYNGYKIYLSYVDEAKDVILQKIKQNKLSRIILVKKDSYDFLKIMAIAKYFFTDFHLFPQFIKREDQVVVSLWHGTPLKTLGKDCKTETQISVQRIFYLADYQVYPGRFMEEKMLDVYWLNNIYQGKVMQTGYPRNSLLFNEDRRKEIRKELNLENKQVIMYMPTFRGAAGNNKNDEQANLIAKYLEELDSRLNDNQIFYTKLHNYNTSRLDYSKYHHIFEAPTQYDNYELQSACDIMITDYSSVFFDFAVSRRKIILFQYDQDEYLSTRGVCIPLNELPFPIVKDVDGLIKEINSSINYDDKAFLEKYATYDNINASKILCEHVILNKEIPSPYKERKVEHNGKKNIFIYTNELRTRQSSLSFWDTVNKLDFSKANYFIMYFDPMMWKNAYRLLPANESFSQIGMWSYTSYTKEGKILHDKYVYGRDTSDEVKVPLMKMYKRELVKHFGGRVHCDCVVIWDSLDPGIGCLFENLAEHRVAVYDDGFEIWDKALVDSVKNYRRTTYSKFVEYMNNEDYLKKIVVEEPAVEEEQQ